MFLSSRGHVFNRGTSMDMTTEHRSHSVNGGGPLSGPIIERLLKTLVPPCRPARRQPSDRDENRQATRELLDSLDPRDQPRHSLPRSRLPRRGPRWTISPALRGLASPTRRRSACAAAPWPPGAPTPRLCAHCASASAAKPAVGRRPAAAPRPAPAADPPRPDAAPLGPRRIPAARPVRQADPNFPDRADDAGTVARNPRLAADPALEAAAIVEEQAMIAEQAALQRRSKCRLARPTAD